MAIPDGVKEGTTVYTRNRHKYKVKRQSRSEPEYYYVKRKGRDEKKIKKKKLYFKDDLPAKKKRNRSSEEDDTPKKARIEKQVVGEKEVTKDEEEFGPVQEFTVALPPPAKTIDPPKRFFGPTMPPSAVRPTPAFHLGTDFNAKAKAAQYPYIPESQLNKKIIEIVSGLKSGTVKMDKTPHQDQHFTINRISPGYHFYLANEDATVWRVTHITDGHGNKWA
jgi:hypothetical protein